MSGLPTGYDRHDLDDFSKRLGLALDVFLLTCGGSCFDVTSTYVRGLAGGVVGASTERRRPAQWVNQLVLSRRRGIWSRLARND